MQLVDFDRAEDIAIFRAYGDSSEDISIFSAYDKVQHPQVHRPKRTLQLDELDVLSPTIHETGILCFAVAYSLADIAADAKWLGLMAQKAPTVHTNIMKGFNPTHRYAYMVANYFTTLKTSPAGNRMIQDIDAREKKPEFSTIFKSNSRALAVGQVIPRNTNETLGVGPFFKGKYVEREPINISSYYGCSGGMVVIFKADGIHPRTKVIGMLSAGDFRRRPVNQLSAFTQDGKDWIEGHVNGTRPARYPRSS